MTDAEIDAEARLLYDECPSVKPTWDQCGDVTRSVWRDRVLAGERAVLW
jgi:hypothetical protein